MNDSKKNINSCFITRPAYLSVELNAHNLLYLILLVKQKHLPKQALIYVPLFNSQACESIFRDTRSLSGTFSRKINFIVKNFLRRSQQLSLLNELKYNQQDIDISFPVHHKHKSKHSSVSPYYSNDIDTLDIEQIVLDAYDQAISLVEHSKMYQRLNECNISSLSEFSEYVYDVLYRNSKMISYTLPTLDSQSIDDIIVDHPDDPASDDEDIGYRKIEPCRNANS